MVVEGTVLFQVVQLLSRNDLSFGDKIQQGLEILLARVGAERGSIMLLSDDWEGLEVMAASESSLIGLVQPLCPDSVSGHVLSAGKALLVADIKGDARFKEWGRAYKTTSLVSVPLVSGRDGRVLGVVNMSDKSDETSFKNNDVDLLATYAGWISPLLENCRLLETLREEKDRYKVLARELEHKRNELLSSTLERMELVQMVVHDFKSPLSAVIATYDLLLYMGVEEQRRHIVENGMAGAKKLLEMINDFLEIARIQDRERVSSLEPVRILPVVCEQLERISPVAEQKGLVIQDCSGPDIRIWADDYLLPHLFQNLFSNAVKYTPEHGTVRVGWEEYRGRRAADRDKTLVKIWVEDSGMGIPDTYKQGVFEKFSRTSQAAEQGIQGTGIGLYMCKKIVGLFQGTIWVEDSGIGGSRFCVSAYVYGEERP